MNRTTAATTTATAALTAAAAALALAAPALAGAVRASGEVVRYTNQTITGNAAPAGATARVQSVETGDGRTIVTLNVSGMQAFGQYGAHAHVGRCGDPAVGKDPSGSLAGGHYQQIRAVDHGDQPTDPRYAHPGNEIWLDLATNRAGEGQARSVVDWQFVDGRRPLSVIIHERFTSTADGTAGKRVACLDVDF